MFSKTTNLETLLDFLPDALVGIDKKNVIRYVNRQTGLLFGYDLGDLIGQPLERLVPESRWQIDPEHRDDSCADSRPRSGGLDLNLAGRHRDGRELPISVRVSRIDAGDVLLVIAAVRNVDTQKQAGNDAQIVAAILEYSDDAIIGSTPEGVITSWNPAAERMYGYTGEEIIGKSYSILIPEDRAEEIVATVAKAKDGKAIEHFESARVRKDGSVVPVSLTVVPVRDAEGAIVGASVMYREMTEQRRAFEVAQRMEAIVQSSDDAIIGRTLEGVVTSWNRAAERMFGYSSQEMVGTSINCVTPEDRLAESAAVVAKVRSGQHVERLETVRSRRDGTVFPVSITISPIRDIGGAIVGASAVVRDVTEQRRAFEVAQRMEAIVEGSDDAIFAITLEGVVTSWNRAAEIMFGYTGEEIIGQPAETVSPVGRPEEMKDILAKVRTGQQTAHLETVRVRRDGVGFPVSLTVSPICDASGAIVGASMISRNMVELRHAARYARSLIEAGLDPLVTISPAGRITDVNEATVEITGVPREGLIGSDFSRYFTDRDMAQEAYERAFAQGSLTDYPLTLCHQDGTLTHLLYNASVYRDFNDNVLGVLAVARDASKLRQQQRLSEQLQVALGSRVMIEQAKGITAQRHRITIDQAYQRMRVHARNNNASLRTVAEAIVAVGLQV